MQGELEKPGPENESSNKYRSDCRNKDRRGGDIFRVPCKRMDFRRVQIHEELDGCIDGLGDPNANKGDNHHRPFQPGELEYRTGGNDNDRGGQMNLGIGLSPDKDSTASEGRTETA